MHRVISSQCAIFSSIKASLRYGRRYDIDNNLKILVTLQNFNIITNMFPGVVVTILLAFAVFLDVLRGSLPHNSTSILSWYVLLIMLQVSLSFLGTCAVITLRQKGNNDKTLKPPPKWVMKDVFRGIYKSHTVFKTVNCI